VALHQDLTSLVEHAQHALAWVDLGNDDGRHWCGMDCSVLPLDSNAPESYVDDQSGMDRATDSSEPLYARVTARVRDDVRGGLYSPGDRLPSEVDLARQLGVSRGTVRQALVALLDEGLLQTVPGRGTFVSDGSHQRAAGLIGMILPSVVRARNPELIGGVEEMARHAGYSLILGISGDDRWLEAEQIQRIVDQGAHGLIVYTVDGPMDVPALRRLIERGFPVVLIDRYIPDMAVDTVTMDNIGGGFLAVQHLAQLGYRRIGYVSTDNIATSSIVERQTGYRWAMQQYGLQFDSDLICTDVRRLLSWPPREPDKQLHNERVLRAYLDRPDRPEAIFVCNDYVAFEVVQVAEQLGMGVPDDLALVGFDNVSYTDYFGVPLTTVEQYRHEIGATATSLLLDRIAGRRTRLGRTIISTRLVVRRSSGPGPTREQSIDTQEGSRGYATVPS
jgi:DNA-binding LacI/PurR family transcriptional regulator